MYSPSQRSMRIKYIMSEEHPLETGNCFTDTRRLDYSLLSSWGELFFSRTRRYNLMSAKIHRLTQFSDDLSMVELKMGSM